MPPQYIQIVTVKPQGYLHSEAFAELADTLRYGLEALGMTVERVENQFSPTAVNLVLGWHLLREAQEQELPPQCILYNLEQMDDRNRELRDRLIRLSSQCEIWDYSRRNIELLHAAGFPASIQLVPIGSMPGLSRIESALDQDIDVLFYGSINGRRNRAIEALRGAGLRVHVAFGVYGKDRDALISRSKVVLNLHYYETSIFEMVRVSYLWSNRKAVVAERHQATEVEAGLEGAARFVPYGQLVAACQDLVADTAARKALEVRAYEIMSARDEAEILNRVLAGEMEVPCPGNAERGPGRKLPLSSVIIPVFNKVEYTQQCIEKLYKGTPGHLFELILVDNASTDETPSYLAGLKGDVKVITNAENLGFVDACNQGAAAARGHYLVFLNNDTAPLQGWLEALVEMAEGNLSIGAAGSRLVYPDGRLQEAGGLIFQDGSGWNFGRFEDPLSPAFADPAEVDYCSGAALLVRKDVFERLGGFDRRYAPAYYEDTDLCFGVRSLGLKVMYCPDSTVIHFEGITAGTDLTSGFKRYQAINREKFAAKWAKALAQQDPPPTLTGQAPITADRRRLAIHPSGGTRPGVTPVSQAAPIVRPHVLIVDPLLPLHDRASGSLRLYRIILILRALKCDVTYIARNGMGQETYKNELESVGVKVYATDPEKMAQLGHPCDAPVIDLAQILAEHPCQLAWLSFYDIAEQYLPDIRRISPDTTVIVDTVDVHFLRETRQAELAKDATALQKAATTRARELAIYGQADLVVTVTEADAAVLRGAGLNISTAVVPNIHLAVGETPGWEARRDLLFVGNFNHTPNIDAALWLCREIMPKVQARIPGIRLSIIGPNPPAEVQALAGPAISVLGWVPDTGPHLDAARVSVAPLRVGAGMKGKVGEALSRGIPVVTTTIGAEGMDLQAGHQVMVADDPDCFAEAVARLYENPVFWEGMARAGREVVDARYGLESVGRVLQGLLGCLRQPRVQNQPDYPGVGNESDIYNAMYAERSRSNPEAMTLDYWRSHFATRTAISESPDCGRLLDVGCGTGEIDIWLARAKPDLRITGLDLSDVALASAKGHLEREPVDVRGRIDFRRGTLEDLDLSSEAKFDGCLISHTLEHIKDHQPIFARLQKHLHPSSTIIAVVPNGHHHDDPTHVWHFSTEQLARQLGRFATDVKVWLSEEGDQIAATGRLKHTNQMEGDSAEAIQRIHAGSGKIVAMLRIKDESEWIAEVLASIEKIADEIVILDDHSTDDTVSICRTFSKVVDLFEQKNLDVDEARDKNLLLQMALNRNPAWILAMDGDEVLEDSASARIRAALESAPEQVVAFEFEWLYFWNDRAHYRTDGKYNNLWHRRLFRVHGQDVKNLRFMSTQHGSNFHCGSIPGNLIGSAFRLDVKVKHFGYFHLDQRKSKFEFYQKNDPEAAAKGYYDHLIDETNMILIPWEERSFNSNNKISSYFKNTRPEVANLVPHTARRILDVGCGAGALGAFLKARSLDMKVYGIEINPEAAEHAGAQLDAVFNLDLEQMDAALPFNKQFFECIIFADILEHLKDPLAQLNRFKPYLASNGFFVLSIPNVRFFQVVHDLLVNGAWTYQDEGILDRTHLRFFTLESLIRLLAESGFEVDQVEAVKQSADASIIPMLTSVATAGGDVRRASEEMLVFQYLVRARRARIS